MVRFVRRPIVVAAALALFALSACTTAADSSGSSSGGATTFRMAMFPTGNTLDPWKTVITTYTAQAAYDTLTHLDADGKVVPWLATDWKFTDSKTLDMNLQKGVKFTDGTPFNADAVKANIDYAKKANPANFGAASVLVTIASVEVVDEDSVVFHLASANPDLPYGLSYLAGWMVSPKALADNPDKLATNPVGTGPYILDESKTTANQTYTYKKNPNYWAADKWNRFDTLVVKLMGDPTASDNAARTNEIDYEAATPTTNIPGWDITNGSNTAMQGLSIYDLNGKITKALGDLRVRQAMNYAIDRKTILDKVLNGVGTQSASTPFNPDSLGWSDSLLDIYPYDVAKAKELLKEAGYPDGFTIKVLSNPQWSQLAQAIAGYLRKVGINIELSEHTTDLIQQTNSGKWAVGMSLQPVYGLPFTDVSATMTPTGWMNPNRNSDPKINELLNQAAEASDDAAREPIYADLAKYAAEQAWFVMPVITSERHAHNPKVVDVAEPKSAGAPMLFQMTPANG